MKTFQISNCKLQIVILVAATLLAGSKAFAQGGNVNVTNAASKPMPVRWAATNYANGQVTASTSAGTLVIARPTRRAVTFVNTDASITVYIGGSTVTSSNGFPLKAGQSVTWNVTGLVQVIAASGSPVVAYEDEYD